MRLVASFYERVGEFFDAVEAQLRIKKFVVRLRHPLRFTTPSFSYAVLPNYLTQLFNITWVFLH